MRTIALALSDFTDRAVIAVLVRSLLVTLAIFVGLGAAVLWLLDGSDPCGWWGEGSCVLDASVSGLGALLLTAVAAWLLFPAVAMGVVAAASDRVVAAVERRHYPQAIATARPPGVAGALMLGVRSAARLLLYNLLALPIYLVLLVTGIGPLVAFVIVNGIAVGRDLGEMVVVRHAEGAARRDWLRRTRGGRAAIGIVVAALFLVPIVNLAASILGAAMATHFYHRRPASPRAITPTAAG